MKYILFSAVAAIIYMSTATAQYAPQAGVSGSTAIIGTSPQIMSWANVCTIHRGWTDIAQPSLGYVSSGDSAMATGPVDFSVVSLGDSGIALLTFANPIMNGTGPDFAVFENGFVNPANPEEAFLELAHVEVSSDGVNFYRFPSASETQSDTQIAGAGIYMDARKINNLAGKYRSNYGTPFDLQELSSVSGLDINNITHVRIIDAVGSVDGHSSYDQNSKIINDPYPTPFSTGGFDLDAVGVIHQGTASIFSPVRPVRITTYPNPTSDQLHIKCDEQLLLNLSDITGKMLWSGSTRNKITISLSGYTSGIYFLSFTNATGTKWVERISKQ